MEQKTVGAAIIGYGGMGSWHAQRLREIAGIELRGVYDIDPARNALAVSRGVRAYGSAQELLNDSAVDFVTVAVPNDQHLPVCRQAMRAGKHVVCEKPVALSHAELAEMIAVSKACGVVFTVHQNRRWDEDYLIAKKLYTEGTLGPVFNIESRVHGSRGIPGDWRNRKACGGGMVLDWGVHLLDQILQMVALPIETVYATLSYVTNEECDDGFKVLLGFEGGLSAQIEVGTSNFVSLPRWYIEGENGTAVIEDFEKHGKIVMVSDWEKRDAVPVVTAAGLTKTMAPRTSETIQEYPLPELASDIHDFYRNVAAAVRGEAAPIVTHRELMRSMLLMEAIFESAEQKKVIADFEARFAGAVRDLL